MVSLLRSPAFGHCLERYAQDYPMPTSGICDGGWHHFTLSLLPHRGEADMSRLAADASALNAAPPAVELAAGRLPPSACAGIKGNGVELVAAKREFGGNQGLVLRILNLSNQPTECSVTGPGGQRMAMAVDRLTEDCPEPALQDGRLGFRPFEVKTLKLGR